jgi:hypothetical protein
MRKETFNGQNSVATSAFYKVEVYNPNTYKQIEVLYFENPNDGIEYANSFFDTRSPREMDYQEYYREYAHGPWIEVQY